MYYQKYLKYKKKYKNLLSTIGGASHCNREQKIKCRDTLTKCNNDNEFKKFVCENIIDIEGTKYIDIELILFSQNTINLKISNPEPTSHTIKDILNLLINGTLKITDINYINVNPIKHKGKFYVMSKDNRRLAIFNGYYRYLQMIDPTNKLLIPVNIDFCVTSKNVVPICDMSHNNYTCNYGYFYNEILDHKEEFYIKDYLNF